MTQGIYLPMLGLIGRRDAGVTDQIDRSVTIHSARLFCYIPFVTNEVQRRSGLMNSGARYTFWGSEEVARKQKQ